MLNHPAIPSNPCLWSLHRLLDMGQRWLDHTESRQDYEQLEEFIYELELKICELSQTTEHLQRCFEATYEQQR